MAVLWQKSVSILRHRLQIIFEHLLYNLFHLKVVIVCLAG